MKILFLFFFVAFSLEAKVVLIDPGHGGDEIGAVGHLDKKKKIFEKDLSLRLAKLIKDELSKSTTAYLTRSLDRLVTLQERANMAEEIKADLFISVHFNSAVNAKSHGFELYYLDNNSNAAAQKVERAENLNLKGEELIVNQILVDLVVQQTVSHSKQLAQDVSGRLSPILKKYQVVNRGVKPGLFYVLALSKRPGLLIEGGFVSNPKELKKVNQEAYLSDMARAISAGIVDFINRK